MLPNDYEDIITGGRNTALDLINAPLAWNITTGDPNVVILTPFRLSGIQDFTT